MTINDPVADMITRIRNAQMKNKQNVKCNSSKLIQAILEVMKNEGFIENFQVFDVRKNIQGINIKLKYFEGHPVVREIRRISKPGRRVYTDVKSMPRFYNGLGVTVLSTSKGVVSAVQAIENKVGGEVLCEIF